MPVGFTTVTASHLQYANDVVIDNATITFTPVDPRTGAPLCFRSGGTDGATSFRPVKTEINAGAMSIVLADTTLTSPTNIGYKVVVTDNLNTNLVLLLYPCIQPSGTTWSLDDYQPSYPALSQIQYGPQGTPGTPGSLYGNVLDADLVGPTDGTNLLFTVNGIPASVKVFKNGQLLRSGLAYTYTPGTSASPVSTITFTADYVPIPDDWLYLSGYTNVVPVTTVINNGGGSGTGVTATGVPTVLLFTDTATSLTWAVRVNGDTLIPVIGTAGSSATPAASLLLQDQDGTGRVWACEVTNGAFVAVLSTATTAPTQQLIIDSYDGTTYAIAVNSGVIGLATPGATTSTPVTSTPVTTPSTTTPTAYLFSDTADSSTYALQVSNASIQFVPGAAGLTTTPSAALLLLDQTSQQVYQLVVTNGSYRLTSSNAPASSAVANLTLADAVTGGTCYVFVSYGSLEVQTQGTYSGATGSTTTTPTTSTSGVRLFIDQNGSGNIWSLLVANRSVEVVSGTSGSTASPVASLLLADTATGAVYGLQVANGAYQITPSTASASSAATSLALVDQITNAAVTVQVTYGSLTVQE